jgi:hypothetical protein
MDRAGATDRAAQRDLVRRGYDAISMAYRSDSAEAATSAEDVGQYAGWVAELAAGLEPVWHRYVPEGAAGHSLILASAAR